MDMFTRFGRILLSADADANMLRRVEPEISESNRKSLITFSVIEVVFMLLMTAVSFLQPQLADSRILYLGGAALGGAFLYLSSRPARKNRKLTLVLMYAFSGILLLFGIVLGTVTVPNEITATYIALLLTVPQMFTDRPWRMYALIFSSVSVFIFMVVTHKDPVTWSSDIINSLVFGSVSAICSTYMMMIKVQRFCLVETVRFMAENDQLTGVRNRNSYESRLQNAAILNSSSIFCVYVDVNGLHELNNDRGHEAGDRMLQYVATVMQNIFGSENTYRIGGDEFIALGTDRDEQSLQAMVERMRDAVEAGGYHVAIGLGHRSKTGLEIDALIRQAETAMYADKRAYYLRTGIDRRRH